MLRGRGVRMIGGASRRPVMFQGATSGKWSMSGRPRENRYFRAVRRLLNPERGESETTALLDSALSDQPCSLA